MGVHAGDGVSLGDDMLVEILTRLPLKSFSRSKCVSKTWLSLLSDDYARSKLPLIVSAVFQSQDSVPKNGPTYVSASNADFESGGLDFFPHRHSSTLIDCCNGLLLFYSSLTGAFHVCNPTTGKYVPLPKPTKETKLSILAFDPYHSRHFRVVNFVGWRDHGVDIEMFDSEPGGWVEHRVDWGIDSNAVSATVRYMDGVLYLLARTKQAVRVGLGDMSASLMELPEPMTKECCVWKVGGRLHYSNSDGQRLRIWMLSGGGDDEEGGWLLKHCVSFDKMEQVRVLGLHPERDVAYLGVKGRLVAYDVCEKRIEEAWELKGEKGHLIQVWVFPFSKYLERCLDIN